MPRGELSHIIIKHVKWTCKLLYTVSMWQRAYNKIAKIQQNEEDNFFGVDCR